MKEETMATTFPVTADQYTQVLALRDACHKVQALLQDLKDAHIAKAGEILTVFGRQDNAEDDLPPAPQTTMTGQKLKWLRKLRGNVIVVCDLLDSFKAQGVPGTAQDIWTPLRAMNDALNGIVDENGRPYVAGQKHGL
jgi:hypothetical protein